MNIDLFRDLPSYHQLYITCNGHHTNYESMNDYINLDFIKDHISFEDAQECLLTNCIWELQIYLITPISFYKTVSFSLERAIKLMLENCKDGKWI